MGGSCEVVLGETPGTVHTLCFRGLFKDTFHIMPSVHITYICHTLSVVTAYMYSVHSVNVTQGINRYFYFSCSNRIFMWWIVCPIIFIICNTVGSM